MVEGPGSGVKLCICPGPTIVWWVTLGNLFQLTVPLYSQLLIDGNNSTYLITEN